MNIGRLCFICCILLLFIPVSTLADKWRFHVGTTNTEFSSSDIKCVVTRFVEASYINNYPDFSTTCYNSKSTLFKLPFGAQEIIIPENHKYVIGLSNSGFHRFAFWVTDLDGKLLLSLRHSRTKTSSFYCTLSVTSRREWYLPKSEYKIRTGSDNQLSLLEVSSCKGGFISLIDKASTNNIKNKYEKQFVSKKVQGPVRDFDIGYVIRWAAIALFMISIIAGAFLILYSSISYTRREKKWSTFILLFNLCMIRKFTKKERKQSILGVLLVAVVPFSLLLTALYFAEYDRFNIETQIQIEKISEMLEEYNDLCGSYPKTDDGLRFVYNFVNDKSCNLGKKYESDYEPVDSWDNLLLYESNGISYKIRSTGEDGLESKDDIYTY